MTGLEILGTGHALADKIVTNDDMAKLVDTDNEWIVTRTGIRERRFVEKETNVSLASRAAQEAMNNAGIAPKDIAVCIVATVSPDNIMPSTACNVAKNLSLENHTLCFDLNAACSGFLYALHTAYSILAQNENKCALIIGSEVLSRLVDMTDRGTCVLFGDGSGAAIVKRSPSHPFGFISGCDPNTEVLSCTAQNPVIKMDGAAVFRFAVDIIPKCVNSILEQTGFCLEDIDRIVCHQANKRIIESSARRLQMDISKFFMNLQYYGNTSAASIPLALHELCAKKGEKIICVGFGAGLTYGAALITM